MQFEWDPKKAQRNIKAHGVSCKEAATVFGDYFSFTYPDPDHSISEERFITIGTSLEGNLLFIAHTDREDRIRIISARKTTRAEQRMYEEESKS